MAVERFRRSRPQANAYFNPMLQSKRFDPEAVYIRRYLPELTNVPLKHIHNPVQYALPLASPIVFHAEQVSKAKRDEKWTTCEALKNFT